MGTRITVELWAEDTAKAEQAIDAVLDEMRHIDETMSTYKPTSEVSQVNAKAADGPMHISKELFDLLTTAKEYSVITDGRLRHHLRERRLPVRFSQARAPGRGANRQGIARRQLSPRDPRSEKSDGAVLAERSAHRSRRHRQGLFGGSRHRRAEIAGLHARLRGRRAATAGSSAIDSASPGSWASAIRERARAT